MSLSVEFEITEGNEGKKQATNVTAIGGGLIKGAGRFKGTVKNCMFKCLSVLTSKQRLVCN